MAGRRLRSRRCYCFGFDGNLQLPSESLCVAFAYAHGNGDAYSYGGTEVDSFTTAPSHTGASAVALRAPNDWAIDD